MKLSRTIGLNLIIAMLSIENILFLNYKIAGLDIVDIGVLVGFAVVFYSSYISPRRRLSCSLYVLAVVGFAVLECLFSFAKGHQLRYILPDVRDLLFMVFTYEIFKNEKTDVEYILSIVPVWSLINSLIALGSFGFFNNAYSREIYTPLWISVFSIGCILFKKEQNNGIVRYCIAVINLITIVLSQTRSYIIPVLIMFVLYGVFAIKDGKKFQVILVAAVIFVCILFLKQNGYYEMIVNRMTGSFGTESTMWLRFENSINRIKSMNLLDWIVGKGFGERFYVIQYDRTLRECSDLEMFIPNQLVKWGSIFFASIYSIFIMNIIRSGLKQKPKALLVSAAVILVGGFISGLTGMIGSVILGIIFGMLANHTRNNASPKKTLDEVSI